MNKNAYNLVRKVHLYASLPIVAFLLMYVVSSYFMIHHEWFDTYEREEAINTIQIDPIETSDTRWPEFLTKNGVSGKLINENTSPSGDLIRKYSRAGKEFHVSISPDQKSVEIKTFKGNFPGFVVGLHRIRGFGGSWQYNFYALMLDVVGISLILFAITGAILWLQLLKKDRVAWIVFGVGFIYVVAIIACLMII